MINRLQLEVGSEPFPGLILRQLRGRGGFAEVWEAHNERGQSIALKFITGDRATTIREVKSVQAIQKLSHRNLLKIDKVCCVPGYIVVEMELAEASMLDLMDVYQQEFNSAIPPSPLLRYFTQAASALDFMNQRKHPHEGRLVGFQHCDIKPSNLLLVNDNLKLGDFGLSAPTTAALNPAPRAGTLDFAAPEIHRGMLSERSDLYSLAVSYYYLRTGRFPFPPPPSNFVRKYSYTRPEPDLSLVSRAEQRVLHRALYVQPERRWDSCKILIDQLREAIDEPDNKASSTLEVMLTAGHTS